MTIVTIHEAKTNLSRLIEQALRGEEVVISTSDSKVTVWVIPTNEELMIAQDTAALTR